MSVSRGCITHDGFRGVISKPASCTRVLASKKWSCFEYVGITSSVLLTLKHVATSKSLIKLGPFIAQ